ncbi:hypothetical protein ANAPH1_00135 [Anaplasma phagocytophilum]|nr:hypothetical protein ANAPH1_00135 [Anaplasma phagocytophilum]SCV65490.1 hypothetical protein ANAPH2_01280 [Anaplasma phagocytophilum]
MNSSSPSTRSIKSPGSGAPEKQRIIANISFASVATDESPFPTHIISRKMCSNNSSAEASESQPPTKAATHAFVNARTAATSSFNTPCLTVLSNRLIAWKSADKNGRNPFSFIQGKRAMLEYNALRKPVAISSCNKALPSIKRTKNSGETLSFSPCTPCSKHPALTIRCM